jgi:hypothetical protein
MPAHRGRAIASSGARPVSGDGCRHRRHRKGWPLPHARTAADAPERSSPLRRRQAWQQIDDGAAAVAISGYV